MPAAMEGKWKDEAGQARFRSLQAKEYTHPMVSIWQDPAAGTLATARFYETMRLVPLEAGSKEAGNAVTVLNYAEGGRQSSSAHGGGESHPILEHGEYEWNDFRRTRRSFR